VQYQVRAFAWMVVAGCTVGAPPGFSTGDRWTFPLVGPLEDGLLVTPVSVRGHGPYLFAFDPDASITAIDKQVVDDAELRTSAGPHIVDETDTGQIRFLAELLDLRVANLTIDRRDVMVFPVGLYDTEDRHLSGILSRDVLADSLVFGFDRDQGIASLSTIKAFTPPPGTIAINYQSVFSPTASAPTHALPSGAGRAPTETGAPAPNPTTMTPRPGGQGRSDVPVIPVQRRLATARIGGATFAMHLDLGASVSQLREPLWGKAGLGSVQAKLRLVDEAASVRQVTTVGVVTGDVAVGAATSSPVTFVPYIEKRFTSDAVDGALGLNFFRPYAVYANWDRETFYLKPRGDAAATTTARLGRWGAALPACPHPGRVTAALTPTGAGATIDVARDPQAANHALEVLLGVTLATGHAAAPLVVELPSGIDKVTNALPASYAGATLAVLDASPFTRPCAMDGGCVVSLGPEATPGAPAPAGPPPPKAVPLARLHRLTGEQAIPPSDDVTRTAAGAPIAAAIVKVCLSADGKVDATRIVKSSGVPAYDEQLQRTIKETWTFEPVEADGKPAPVCTSVTFLAR
jgi:TonB family protein